MSSPKAANSNGEIPRPTPMSSALAQIVEHQELFQQPKRMIERQQEEQRAEPDVLASRARAAARNTVGDGVADSGVAWCSVT